MGDAPASGGRALERAIKETTAAQPCGCCEKFTGVGEAQSSSFAMAAVMGSGWSAENQGGLRAAESKLLSCACARNRIL